MIITKKIKEIKNILDGKTEYRIINNTLGKLLILLTDNDKKLLDSLIKKIEKKHQKYIQEIIVDVEYDKSKDEFIINRIKELCPANSIIHRNTSYIAWSGNSKTERINNVVAGYSFKGGMGRSSTLAYLSYFYSLIGKTVAVLDCDFEAPGIASMFLKKEERKKKAGILDYLIDLNIEEDLDLKDYFFKEDNLYLFSSGIDYNIKNYLNKISKIDFNSTSYTNNLTKLIIQINIELKPDFIFIDLRAGINESNGSVLKEISGTNLLFFNGEEQSKDGLNIVLNSLNDYKNSFIMNSTIRISDSTTSLDKKKELIDYIYSNLKFFKEDNIIHLSYNSVLLENKISEYQKFVKKEINSFIVETNSIFLFDIINKIGNRNIEINSFADKQLDKILKRKNSMKPMSKKEIISLIEQEYYFIEEYSLNWIEDGYDKFLAVKVSELNIFIKHLELEGLSTKHSDAKLRKMIIDIITEKLNRGPEYDRGKKCYKFHFTE